MKTVVIRTDLQAARAVEEAILALALARGYSAESLFAMKLALDEALTNAIRHGNAGDPAKSVRVDYSVDRARVVVCVTDEGPGFRPERVPDPTCQENLENPSGRGIMLMRAYMDEVQFNPCGNAVRMVKRNT